MSTHDIVAADGTKTTAPDDTAATVLAHAVANPNTTNMAETSYAAANITLPGNGADPGIPVDLDQIQPADIVRFADHDCLVWGDGKVLNPDNSLQPIGDAINAGAFKGIFHVPRTPTLTNPDTPENNPPPTEPTTETG